MDKENKTFEETIVAGNMEEAKKTAQESNPESKIVSAKWVYKWFIFTFCEFPLFPWINLPRESKVKIEEASFNGFWDVFHVIKQGGKSQSNTQ